MPKNKKGKGKSDADGGASQQPQSSQQQPQPQPQPRHPQQVSNPQNQGQPRNPSQQQERQQQQQRRDNQERPQQSQRAPPGFNTAQSLPPGVSTSQSLPPGFSSARAPVQTQQLAAGSQGSVAQSQGQQQPQSGPPQNQPQPGSSQQQGKPKGQGGSKNKYPKKDQVPTSTPKLPLDALQISERMPMPAQERPVSLPSQGSAESQSESTSRTATGAVPKQRPTGAVPKQMPQSPQQQQQASGKMLFQIESSPDGTVYQGSRGKKCTLEVNYLQILVNKLIPKAFHYDVEFTPDIPKKLLPKALDKLMLTYFSGTLFAFDGRKNFYTNKMLEVKGVTLDGSFEQEVEAVLGDRSKTFKVKVKLATVVDMSVLRSYQDRQYQYNDKPSQAIQCLDVILRAAFKSLTAANRAVNVGRALYMPTEGHKMDLGEGMELWLGLFQSAVLGRSSLYLNVDVAHKAFPSAMSLLDYLKSCDRNGVIPTRLADWQSQQLKEFLKMLSVEYRLPGAAPKSFGFNDLKPGARSATFLNEAGVRMSVFDYFRSHKNIQLRYPDLPCLHVGSKTRNIYLPLELCWIAPGQATNKKCTPNCLQKMIRFSATTTDERKLKIQNLLKKINYDDPNGEVKGFGIEVKKDFQTVDGRVIEPPQIQYIRGIAKPSNGVWNGQAFIQTQSENIKWGIINCDGRTSVQSAMTLANNISQEATKQGMRLAQFSQADYYSLDMMQYRYADMENALGKYAQGGYKLVFVIIIDRNDCYAKVKQAAELKVGILTQCIKSNTITRMANDRNPMMTINNILLKVNAKLGGKNHEVNEMYYQKFNDYKMNNGVMFVGADVTHPSPDQRDIPSVVGVAASHDDVGFRYQCAWRLQNPKAEMIVDLENILTDQLLYYKTKNGRLPTKIMYYRDGVSEGQFTEVLNIEMTAIRGAMRRAYGTAQPAKVTFIVVQKRHHTRFFPTHKAFSTGKFNNILAGTVVDSNIVHPFQYQFFLASHAAIQGVTKPSKYCVLINESKIPPDDLQAITYDLCHLFTRCNRSVSYPAPTYYAHLVAARGKQYTIGHQLDMNNLQREFNNRLIRPQFSRDCPMFFV